jgi:tRNA dimethylallyltransferase
MNLDPEAAKRIHSNDAFRIIRALETYEVTGKTISTHHQEHRFSQHPFEVLKIGLIENRDLLYQRINIRVDKMLEQGFLKEVEGLLERDFSPQLKSMQSIGYRHMIQFMEGNVSWEETIRILKRDTRRYAKRQFTWFQADPDLVWKSTANLTEIEQMVTKLLNS